MNPGWFIAGTDTGVGKTRIAEMLLDTLARHGQAAVGMKPVACGCRRTAEGLRNDDAERLLARSSGQPDYADVNPYALEPGIAPSLAAQAAGVEIQLSNILYHFERLHRSAPQVVVEGVGGWLVPLGPTLTMADVAGALGLPVILVVGMRLGCINHALLTAQAMRQQGVTVAGWVANQIDADMMWVRENVELLKQRLEAPLLAEYTYQRQAVHGLSLPVFPIERLTEFTADS